MAEPESEPMRAAGGANVAVLILTYNEEPNLAQALASVCGWAREVFVLDSYSSDATQAIAASFDCRFFQHRFRNYSEQRNHALTALPISSEWVLFLDADEWMTGELKKEISEVLAAGPAENGYYIKRRFIWLGQWIKRGYYPTWILRLFRRDKGRCEEREVNEHIIVDGAVGYLRSDFIHQDHKDIGEWVAKHNAYAAREAREFLKCDRASRQQEIEARFWGSQAERKRWLRNKVWNGLPPLVRPFLFFFYRYFLRGGCLEGRIAFSYHFLQALWFPLLVDIRYLEMRLKANAEDIPKL